MEAKTQARLIKYLKRKGCYVIKTKPGVGVPVGCPDIFAFYEGWWGAFEVKSSPYAHFQPLQKDTIKLLESWSHARVVYPENLQDIIAELECIL